MSQYYNIGGLKVRVSDHERNPIWGTPDIELFIKSADNQLLSVKTQLVKICQERGFLLRPFKQILKDYKDGSYTINHFKPQENENEEDCTVFDKELTDLINKDRQEKEAILKQYKKPQSWEEIKEVAKQTNISKSFIKKYFNIY